MPCSIVTPGSVTLKYPNLLDILISPVVMSIYSVLETSQSALSKGTSSHWATGPLSFFLDLVIWLTVCSLGRPPKNMIHLKCIAMRYEHFYTRVLSAHQVMEQLAPLICFDLVIRLTVCSLGWPRKNMIRNTCIFTSAYWAPDKLQLLVHAKQYILVSQSALIFSVSLPWV